MKPSEILQLIFVIGALILIGFALAAYVFWAIPEKQLNPFTALASGVVGGAFGAIAGYLFGSSVGSRAKDEALVAAATGPQP